MIMAGPHGGAATERLDMRKNVDGGAGPGRRRFRRIVPVAIIVAAASILLSRGFGGTGNDTDTGPESAARIHVSEIRSPRPGDRFVDVTAEAGLDFVHVLLDGEMTNIVESLGSGAAFLDYDLDGDLDLYLVQTSHLEGVVEGSPPATEPTNRLYRNRGDGTFEDVTAAAGVGDTGFGVAALAADYDGDGRPDLYVCNSGPNRLYRNRGDGTFEDVTGRAGVGDPALSVGASFLDYDADGRLDLYVANYLEFDPDYEYHYAPDVFPPPLAYEPQPDSLFRNLGDGRFEDVSEKSGVRAVSGRGMAVVASDFDDDGRTDIFVSNDGTANFLWHNLGDGTFEERAVPTGVAFSQTGEATAAMTADRGDFDGDGRLDLLVTDTAYGSLYRQDEGLLFQDEVMPTGLGALSAQYVSWGGGFLDYDNDRDLDVLIVNGDLHHPVGWEDLLLENEGGRFTDAAADGVYFSQKLLGRGGFLADYDNDGDIDILITNLMDRPVLLRNDSPAENRWLTLVPAGGAYGARITLHAGGRTQHAEVRCPTSYLGTGDPRLHFGLGGADEVDRIEIAWPSGRRETIHPEGLNRFVEIRDTGGTP